MASESKIWVLAALLTAFSVGKAQMPDAENTLRARANLVLVPTLVQDKRKELVFGLRAEDFILTDDGVPQTIHLEEDTDGEPLALVVLIQAGISTQGTGWHPNQRGEPPNRLGTLSTMVDAMVAGVPHHIAVVGFDSQPEVLRSFTTDENAIATAVSDFTAEEHGDHGAAILDGLGFSVELLRKQPAGNRRAILLVSETRDRDSKLAVGAAVRLLSETNTAIYTLAVSTAYADVSKYGAKNLPTKRMPLPPKHGQLPASAIQAGSGGVPGGVAGALATGIAFENPTPNSSGGCLKDPDAKGTSVSKGYDCLAQLAPPLAAARIAVIAASESIRQNIPETVARLTGGEYFALGDERTMERTLSTIANHLPNHYVLSFQPHTPHKGMHTLTLRLRDLSGLSVKSRAAYWVEDVTSNSNRQ